MSKQSDFLLSTETGIGPKTNGSLLQTYVKLHMNPRNTGFCHYQSSVLKSVYHDKSVPSCEGRLDHLSKETYVQKTLIL
jgi:hypothetical protein